jgi:hypothetical protein
MIGRLCGRLGTALLLGGAVLAGAATLSGARADVTISPGATQNMNCTGSVCTPTATNAVLNAGDLETLLASGSITVTTTGPGVQAQNIDVAAPLTWSSVNGLALDAYDSIAFASAVTVSGAGGLSLATNDGGSGGNLWFGLDGSVTFANLSSALTIDAKPYVLVGGIAALASAIQDNPSGSYALAADYDAAGDGTYKASPIPTSLTGMVQGLGNTISDLSVDVPKGSKATGYGLFSEVGQAGTIASLKMTGYNMAVHVHPNRKDKLGYGAGGMVGVSVGTLFDDHVDGSLWTIEGGGGLVGLIGSGTGSITGSSSSASVSGPGGGGGLVWWLFDGQVSASYATGAVTGGAKSRSGGLVALNDGGIYNSYATGAVKGGANSVVGGLLSTDNSTGYSYAVGKVSGGAGSLVGGFVGDEDGSGDGYCYWDTTTGRTNEGTGNEGNVSGITALTTRQLKSGLPDGFDPTVWTESANVNSGLPYLIANPPE